ncbi:ribosomal protein S18-alanine N-acetyltransferase [uncultured Tateyamaria sp.]|uniref:ribosomal protein S18-alanine N-acetyltransferase n=1 Tax=uncultured Tateyamaria sp. TaxID=455651 RepID=UPI00262D4900|nr:ribosomal protein S18-alanine N-acetyltransferase [uncultured Tateyamaria sp.]
MTPETLARLHAAAFQDQRAWSAGEFAQLIDSEHVFLTAHAHGFALWRAVAGEAELLTIAVDPARQGQGIGHTLMQQGMQQAATIADTVFLEVAQDNAAACALYDRLGFKVMARRPAYYQSGPTRTDALVMRASLPITRT